jgi:prepilin-type N-terminal cleavage/methylation domain-containing protein/prepilin-type processing-associated H-X9-DG protein
MYRKQGFTLIELLVVIAVIAILAGLLFPVFAKARDRARQASCLGNVKQITMGLLVYTDDYDQTYPGGPDVAQAFFVPGPEGSWENMHYPAEANLSANIPYRLLPYIRNTQIFLCPSDPTGERSYAAGRRYEARYARCAYQGHEGLIYGISWPEFPNGKPSVAEQPVSLATVSRPAVLWVVEELSTHHSRSRQGEWRYNAGFADGHAKFTLYMDPWLPRAQQPWSWSQVNPRLSLSLEKACDPTCAEEAARG